MKLLIAAFLGLMLAHGSVTAQEKIWLKQSRVADVIAFEKSIDPDVTFLSQNISLSKDYYPLADKYEVTNPVISARKPIGYLPLNAQYFFTPADSVLRLVSYDWEKGQFGNFFDKQKMWKEESKKLTTYESEYERVRKIIISQLGEPSATDKSLKEVAYGGGKYYTRESVWDTDDVHAQLNMIFESTTYRVRFTLYWKK